MTHPTTTEIAGIVAKLTRSQRRLLMSLTDEWMPRIGQGHGHTRNLYFKGLAEYHLFDDVSPEQKIPSRRKGVKHRLTPLGLAVRAALRETGE